MVEGLSFLPTSPKCTGTQALCMSTSRAPPSQVPTSACPLGAPPAARTPTLQSPALLPRARSRRRRGCSSHHRYPLSSVGPRSMPATLSAPFGGICLIPMMESLLRSVSSVEAAESRLGTGTDAWIWCLSPRFQVRACVSACACHSRCRCRPVGYCVCVCVCVGVCRARHGV